MGNVITVEGLSKRYVLGAQRTGSYQTFREVMMLRARRLFPGKRDSDAEQATRDFWALQDVSFSVQEGDRVGIIGRNGAGKSTLLKILSRITEPTRGRVAIRGRVASLLEVGTGFHPELTGRENIFLNGAILGMSRDEVRRKFDAIVDFASVEKFLDTPVKRYSSGMYVRLAFAVAAHLEPDILIVDEVLAVGDAEFQKKCLTKMGSQQSEGRTVLFVSHNMGAVAQLCNSVVHLQQGQILQQTHDVPAAIEYYMGVSGQDHSSEWHNERSEFENDWFLPTRFYQAGLEGRLGGAVNIADEVKIVVEGDCRSLDPALQIGIAVYASDGTLLFWSYNTDDEEHWVAPQLGPNVWSLCIPPHFLNEGVYRVELGVALYHRQWICEPGKHSPSFLLKVEGGFTQSRYWSSRRPGVLAVSFPWHREG